MTSGKMTSGESSSHHDFSVLSRRTFLGAGAGFMAMGLTPAQSSPLRGFGKAGLFVFGAPRSGNVVIAVACRQDRPNSDRSGAFKVRLHAGVKSWTNSVPARGQTQAAARDGSRAFAGEVLRLFADVGRRYQAHKAVVLEIPVESVCTGRSVDVWAEILFANGPRFRVGNPFIAEIMARDPALADIYHRGFPGDDRRSLADSVARRVASSAAARGIVADPEAYGRRLAEIILPDVITYSPSRPAGFTFSNHNGRHPADPTAAIVQTILTGAVSDQNSLQALSPSADFPYFPAAMAAA
jgi:hypothetical protein